MPELDSGPSMESDTGMAREDHKMSIRCKCGFILAAMMSVAVVALIAVSFQQHQELADLRSAVKFDLRLRDEHLRYVYGLLLREQGGTHHRPSDTYSFDGGFRVAAGDRWCVLDADEEFDHQQLEEQLEFIAHLVFPPAEYSIHTRDHVKWIKALVANELEQLKDAANASPERFVQRKFSGEVEKHANFEQVTTVTVRGSGTRFRFTVRMELFPGWMKKLGH